MNIWFLCILGVVLFAFFVLVRRRYDYAMLFTIAIGFAVNANIYNGITMPVYLGNLRFSIDSILYTGFTFTIIICAHEYDVRRAKVLSSSTIAAILLSAVIEFFAKVSSNGYDISYLINLFGYVSSSFGTFIGVWIALFIYGKMKGKISIYFIMIILVTIISVINSVFYHTYYILVTGNVEGFGYIVAGSYLGKLYATALGLIGFYINTHYWIPLDLMYKYKKIKKGDLDERDN